MKEMSGCGDHEAYYKFFGFPCDKKRSLRSLVEIKRELNSLYFANATLLVFDVILHFLSFVFVLQADYGGGIYRVHALIRAKLKEVERDIALLDSEREAVAIR